MNPYAVAVMGFLCIVFLFIGAALGTASERKAWVLRAISREHPDQSAHHCDGEMYYVVTEECFIQDYQRVPKKEDDLCTPPE